MIKNKLYNAIAKSFSGKILTYIVQFAALAIYARIFSPQEFGIIASIQVFVIFFQMLSNIGIGPAIINENNFDERKRDGIFTVTLFLGLIIAISFYYFSYVLNYFYGGFSYQAIALLVSVSILFSSLNILPSTSLVKDERFLQIAYIEIASEVLCFIVVISLYYNGGGLMSLASRPAVQSIVRFFLCRLLSEKTTLGKAKLGRELFHIKSIIGFSSYQFGFNFINYFSRNLDSILIAKYFGMATVGAYDKAYQLMRYPLLMTTSAMVPAIQPVLTKVRDDKERIVREHNALAARLLFLSIPISVFMFMNSEDILVVLFGEQWLVANDLIKVLSFMIPVQAVLSTSGAFFQVMNKPKLLFISGCIAALVTVSAILVGLSLNNVNYIAMFIVAAFYINFFQIYFVLFSYCFRAEIKSFYYKLLKVIVYMLMPNIIFISLNTNMLKETSFSPIINILISALIGISSLGLFLVLAKKVKIINLRCF